LDAAGRVASFDEPSWETIDNLTNLVAKSLVSADFSQTIPRYRLLETTRAYALDKLRERGELGRLRRRHAQYMKDIMTLADGQWSQLPSSAWVGSYAGELDNLRLSLEWCFGPEGDAVLGAELTVSSAVMWFQLSLVDEGRTFFERAIAALEARGPLDANRQVALLCSLGTALTYTAGPTPEALSSWRLAHGIAREAEDIELELRALWGIWLHAFTSGDFEGALKLAERFSQAAKMQAGSAATDHVRTSHRLAGISLLMLGRPVEASAVLEGALGKHELRASSVVLMQFDRELNARAFYSQSLWLLGERDEATKMAEQCVEDAKARGHATSLSLVLVESGCPIALYCGDLDALEERVCLLKDVSRRHTFGPWEAWGQCFLGSLYLARGDGSLATKELEAGLMMLERTRWPIRRALFLGHLAQALLATGQLRQAQVRIDEALDFARARREEWILPELMRIKAEILINTVPAEAAAWLVRARTMAEERRMGAWLARCESTWRDFAAHGVNV
jgi:tetratricopeptide (TPR) repeat protein